MTRVTTDLIQHWGLLAVLVLMALESCGIPFPSEVIMPFAGATAAGAFGGGLSAPEAVVAGALGNLVGSLVAYALARRFGEPLLLGPGRLVGIRPSHVAIADGWFQRYGLVAVLIGRVLPVVRTYISFPAGMARVRPLWFAILTLVGAVPWCIALTAGGYAVGANYDRVSGPIQKMAVLLAGLVVILLGGWFVRGRHTAEPVSPGG